MRPKTQASGRLDVVIHIKRALNDALLSIAALTLLVGILVAVNERVRHQVTERLTTNDSQTELVGTVDHISAVAGAMFDAVRFEVRQHGRLAFFAIAAVVLVYFMLRL